MRKLVFVAALAVLAWIFIVPSCSTEFDCDAAGSTARADTDECPGSVEEAAGNAGWAAARFATIRDERLTVGLFYDPDGSRHRVESGKDSAAERANELLRELGNLPPGASAFTADHVEAAQQAALGVEPDRIGGVRELEDPRCRQTVLAGIVQVGFAQFAIAERRHVESPTNVNDAIVALSCGHHTVNFASAGSIVGTNARHDIGWGSPSATAHGPTGWLMTSTPVAQSSSRILAETFTST